MYCGVRVASATATATREAPTGATSGTARCWEICRLSTSPCLKWTSICVVQVPYSILEPPGASCPHHEGCCCMFKFALIFCRENAAELQKRGICTVFHIPEGTVADGIWTQRSTSKTPYSRVSDEFDDAGSQGYAMPFFTKPSCHAATHPCMNLCHHSSMKLINRMTELPPS